MQLWTAQYPSGNLKFVAQRIYDNVHIKKGLSRMSKEVSEIYKF